MNLKRSLLIIIYSAIILSISACSQSTSTSNHRYIDVIGTEVPKTNFNPKETVQAAFNYLKSADINNFNQYICYPVEKKGITISAYNTIFGNNPDEKSIEYIKNITADLTYIIGDVKENKANAAVDVRVSNKNLSNLNLKYYENANNPLSEAIKNSNNKIVTYDIKIVLIKTNGIWKIVADDEFQNAISGGLFIPSSEITDKILTEIFN